ncbi:MAG: hypothetical protein P1U72_20740 [Paracoccaceae bacterium]|nr:hypothetical protein [Paracoccaceae bacterium]
MSRIQKIFIAAVITSGYLLLAPVVQAQMSYLESGPGVTFEGCDFDKPINLANGHIWVCSEFGYRYHFGQMTVIQVNRTTKLCVGDLEEAMAEFHDGDCYSGTLYRM